MRSLESQEIVNLELGWGLRPELASLRGPAGPQDLCSKLLHPSGDQDHSRAKGGFSQPFLSFWILGRQCLFWSTSCSLSRCSQTQPSGSVRCTTACVERAVDPGPPARCLWPACILLRVTCRARPISWSSDLGENCAQDSPCLRPSSTPAHSAMGLFSGWKGT